MLLSLSQLKKYIQQRKLVSLQELANQFTEEPLRIECMINQLLHNGCIRACEQASQCGTSCNQCQFATRKWYQWVTL